MRTRGHTFLGWDWQVWVGVFTTALAGLVPGAALASAFGGQGHPALWGCLLVVALLTASALLACPYSPWLPTRARELDALLRLADLQPGERFVDLGAGDGRVVAFLARETEARCAGVERSLIHYLVARLRWVAWGRPPNMELRWANVFQVDLRGADVVYVYATPTVLNARLAAKLSRELSAGARVIVYRHEVDAWREDAREDGGGPGRSLVRYVVS